MKSGNSEYEILDYTKVYERVMQFDKNKTAFVHQWYPFVEGYSKEFINGILSELDYKPSLALDPFAGSGTTPLELQSNDISCISFEVSPFMHLLATVKLELGYKKDLLLDALITVGNSLNGDSTDIRKQVPLPKARTFVKSEKLEKWIFNDEVLDGVLDIKYSISLLKDDVYRNLFKVALASILLDVSNVYRDGKSVKYKSKWRERVCTRREVHQKFLDKINLKILPDITMLEGISYEVNNKVLCKHGDVRKHLEMVPDHSVDLVITSPPYLNSRDYTDIYIVELWMLDLISSYDDLKELRSNTLRSHVQVKHGNVDMVNNQHLRDVIDALEKASINHWNKELPSMIKAYFKDMETLFRQLRKKMMPSKKIYFNVANSAYYGIEIKVDEIIACIAESEGFKVNEIRKARDLKPSSQQKDKIKSLRETVIVMTS
ncbi:DNA methyltransferase [Mucilaginibacter sp. PAMB04168]|uniref:DNA methyltransferase n=1 Tax=Mucilaginibacter sp. PAMB04168 TaxID=3138567 RepID=UPI0031F6EA32